MSANAAAWHYSPAETNSVARYYAITGYEMLIDTRFDDDLKSPVPDEDDLEDTAAGDLTYEECLVEIMEEDNKFIEGRKTRELGWAHVKLQELTYFYEHLEDDIFEWYQYYRCTLLM